MTASPKTAAVLRFLLFAIAVRCSAAELAERKTFSVYVWGQVFDPEACDSDAYVSFRESPECFHHPYETAKQRSHLFDNLQHGLDGREAKKIFLDTTGRLGGDRGCDQELMTTIAEAHQRGMKVYALYGDDCPGICEKELVLDVVDYNNVCGSLNGFEDVVKFDGVAINNEFLSRVGSCEPGVSTECPVDSSNPQNNVEHWCNIIDGLQQAKENNQGLPLHFSLGWWWGECSGGGGERQITRGGQTRKVTDFIMDTVDSIDVQVAWMNDSEEMIDRANKYYGDWFSGRQYDPEDPSFTVTVYTNPVESDVCQISFAPHHKGADTASTDCGWCDNGADCERTQAGMFARFDELGTGLENAHGGFNYYGGVFGTGITPEWPDNSVVHSDGEACSRDEDCNSTSNCVETGDQYGWKVCKQQLTPAPTNAPTSTPCEDDPFWRRIKRKKITNQGCKWVGKKPHKIQNRCKRKGIYEEGGPKVKASVACPKTCGTCDSV